MLESRLETLQCGCNIVLIWGITKLFQKMKFLALYSKSMQLWKWHLLLELWILCMYSKELYFLEGFGDTSNQNYVAAPLQQTMLLSQEPRSEPCLTKLVHFFIRWLSKRGCFLRRHLYKLHNSPAEGQGFLQSAFNFSFIVLNSYSAK